MKLFLFILLFIFTQVSSQNHADILIQHGKIIDGTGNSWFYGDIAIKNGKIVKFGDTNGFIATKSIQMQPDL